MVCTKRFIFCVYKRVLIAKRVHFLTLLITVLISGPFFISQASAQLRIAGGGALGSGMSAGSGISSAVWKRNPTTYWLGAFWTDPDNPSLMYSVDLMGELETRVSVGGEGRIELAKRISPTLTITLYGAASAFMSPFTMYGLGGGVRLMQDTGDVLMFVRLGAVAFFGGSDLPEDSTLVKMDAVAGLLIPLMEVGQ